MNETQKIELTFKLIDILENSLICPTCSETNLIIIDWERLEFECDTCNKKYRFYDNRVNEVY